MGHTLKRVPYMLVVGDKEMEAGEVAVRSRRGDDLGKMRLEDFIAMAQQEIMEKPIKGANNKAQGDKARINDEIKVREVRLIGKDGEQVGVVSLAEATRNAEEASLDLVEISPNAEPPVCKVMDYGKFLFEKSKAQ